MFLDYIASAERTELEEVTRRSGPFVNSLMAPIVEQINAEIAEIEQKTSRHGSG
jgi:hypothetical protein